MIDFQTETIVPFGQVPDRLPRRNSGKRAHIASHYRRFGRGERG